MAGTLLLPVTFACLLALAQPNAASESPETLVKLNLVATNAQGEPVMDLRATDVRVREDGKPRPIVFFRFDGSKRSLQPPAPGEFVNRPTPAPTVILLDRWNERILTTASAWDTIGAALGQAESLDRVYIYFLTNHGDLFPVYPLPVTAADVRPSPRPSPAELRTKLDQAVRKLSGFRDMDAYDPILWANTTFQILTALGSQMAVIAGRKNLIWVTHGIPLFAPLAERDLFDFTPLVRSFSAASVQNEIAIYTVDQSESGPAADPLGQGRETLQMFSALTGGRWYPSDYAGPALTDSFAASRGSYTVAYYSTAPENNRKEHKIRVESSRKGVRLLTREGYFGQAPDPDPDIVERALFSNQIRSPVDASEIGLRVAVSRNPAAGTVHFNIRVDPADVSLERRDEKHQGSLAVMLAFYSEGLFKGALVPSKVDLDLSQDQLDNALKDGIVVPMEAQLKDGIQEIRAIVFDRGLDRLGSVTIPVE